MQARRLVQPYRKVGGDLGAGQPAACVASSGRGAQIQYALVGPDLQKLDQYTGQGACRRSSKNPSRWSTSTARYLPGRPELRLNIDRQARRRISACASRTSRRPSTPSSPGRRSRPSTPRRDQYDVVLQGAGLLPPHAGIDRVGHRADRHRRAGAAAQPGDVQRGRRARRRSIGSTGSGRSPISANPAPGRVAGRGTGGARGGVRVARHGAGLHPGDERPVARARAAPPTTSPSRSRCRSCSCTWCSRRSSSRSSTRSRSC